MSERRNIGKGLKCATIGAARAESYGVGSAVYTLGPEGRRSTGSTMHASMHITRAALRGLTRVASVGAPGGGPIVDVEVWSSTMRRFHFRGRRKRRPGPVSATAPGPEKAIRWRLIN